MKVGRIVLGGIVGGIAFNVVSMAINILALGRRYEILQAQEVFRKEPRLPFLPLWLLVIFAVSIGLVWLYAAARPRLGPGPKTALLVGVTVGLIAGIPHPMAQYSWSYQGGFVSLFQAIEFVLGCAVATLAGAWVYKED
jgi:hypothetical protein